MSGAQTVRRMGRPPSPVVAVRNDAIVALFKLGARPDEIAVQMGTLPAIVYNVIATRRRTAASKPPRRNMVWSADMLTTVTRLWHEGHKIEEIGRRMGLNKNQVIGKVHHLNLPQRRPGRPRLS